jgi:transposase
MDAHSRTHVVVALDDSGQRLGQRTLANTPDGWGEALRWAQTLGPERQWGIEGAWGDGRAVAQVLVGAGEQVREVNPRWTAARRRRSRRVEKTDRHDALAIARLVREEAADLPPVPADDPTSVVTALTTERDQAVAEATRLRNQLTAVWRFLHPTAARPRLATAAQAIALRQHMIADPDPLRQTWAASVRRLAGRLAQALADAATLRAELERRAAPLTPLLAIPGGGPLTAAMLAGCLGPGRRFATDAQVAASAGVAPLEASSAGVVRHRLNRTGNRHLNAILHRIALTQARCHPAARAYRDRRQTLDHKSRPEAPRALKRFLARRLFRAWQSCLDRRLLPLAT